MSPGDSRPLREEALSLPGHADSSFDFLSSWELPFPWVKKRGSGDELPDPGSHSISGQGRAQIDLLDQTDPKVALPHPSFPIGILGPHSGWPP